jgi:hypothetical protein
VVTLGEKSIMRYFFFARREFQISCHHAHSSSVHVSGHCFILTPEIKNRQGALVGTKPAGLVAAHTTPSALIFIIYVNQNHHKKFYLKIDRQLESIDLFVVDCRKGGQVLLRRHQIRVPLDVIMAQPTLKDAIRLSKSVSGLDDKQICGILEIDPAQWSRIFTGQANFPENKLIQFMETCGNIIPVIWLSCNLGYDLQPAETELEAELRQERAEKEELKQKLNTLTETLKAA